METTYRKHGSKQICTAVLFRQSTAGVARFSSMFFPTTIVVESDGESASELIILVTNLIATQGLSIIVI